VNDADIRKYLDRILNLIDARISSWFERAGSPVPIGKARLVAAALHSISVRAHAGQPKAVLDAMAKDLLDLIEPDPNS
jgi:TetR/AcrR family transcriptional regulator, copper-responsive repressor